MNDEIAGLAFATMVYVRTGSVYVRPALKKLAGHTAVHHPTVEARLAARVRKAKHLTEFVRVHLAREEDAWTAVPFGAQGSGVLSSLTAGAGLLVGPADRNELDAGGVYPVIVLDGSSFDVAESAFSR